MIPMTSLYSQNVQNTSSGSYSPASFCRIIGFVCIAGFIIDIFAFALPVAFDNLEWQINILQQISDRSIILLFGIALTLYSSLHHRPWRKSLVATCLTLGVIYLFFAIFFVSSSIQLQNRSEQQISLKTSQMQSQIQSQLQEAESNKTNPKPTPEQIEQAKKEVDRQSDLLKGNTKTATVKRGLAGVGNFLVVGIGLIALGQCGAKASRD